MSDEDVFPHAWMNHGPEPARVAFVLVDAAPTARIVPGRAGVLADPA